MVNVVCAIIIKEGKILVTQLGSKSDHPYKWEFPGGKVKSGESPEDTIIREIKEELQISIQVKQTLEAISYNYGFKEICLIPFICEIIEGNPVLTEHIQLNWITFDELQELNLVEADRAVACLGKNQNEILNFLSENMNGCC
ncbi:MAG: (deoxy)nucleoside triphosphate pyrophosphohydrolase [Mariniphaga sp.]|nr:(deoxy)nucleoside triphosphate pyrophosphohydrolase [Mariniphaga sp.]